MNEQILDYQVLYTTHIILYIVQYNVQSKYDLLFLLFKAIMLNILYIIN